MKLNEGETKDDAKAAAAIASGQNSPTDEEIRLRALNHSKDKLLSIFGHDLRTAIGGVLHISRMLEKQLEAGDLEEAKRLSGLIRRSTQDAEDLLNDLVVWSRKSGKDLHFSLEAIDTNTLIETEIERLKSLAAQKDQRIHFETGDAGTIKADPFMLRSILRNLLTNAIKFSPIGGEIVVRTKRQPGAWEFQVEDHGIGMSEEAQELLLKMDNRKQQEGTAGETGSGFGLLLCEEFIKRHSGHLSWESIPGKGSTFTFNIPELL